jgi:hypothetical protein
LLVVPQAGVRDGPLLNVPACAAECAVSTGKLGTPSAELGSFGAYPLGPASSSVHAAASRAKS